MDTKGFLEAVVAWDVEGYTAICWQSERDGWRTRFVRTIDEALKLIDYLKNLKCNVYFSLARFGAAGERTRENAIAFRSIFTDMDVGPGDPKKYETVNDALNALFAFCQAIGIPYPSYVVGSGTGIHGYWASREDLPRDTWYLFASSFKAVALQWKLKFDAGVTTDAARVLRVPAKGLYNFKRAEPAPVLLYARYSSFGRQYDFAEEFTFAAIGQGTIGVDVQPGLEFVVEATNANQPHVSKQKIFKPTPGFQVAPKFANLPVDDLAEGMPELPPLLLAPILEGCAFLRTAYDTGGRDYSEPLWNLTTLCAVFLENGNELAHKFGNSHPGYSHESTEDKYQRKYREHNDKDVGWPSCKNISDCGFGECKHCPHFAAGKSPLHLGLPIIGAASTPSEVGDEEETPASSSFEVSLHLPVGYTVNEKDYISKKITRYTKVGSKSVPTGVAIESVFTTKVENPHLETREGVDGIVLTVIASGIAKPPQFVTLSQFEAGALNDLGITFNARFPKQDRKGGIKEEIVVLGQSWMEKLRDVMKSQEPSTLGWQYRDGVRIGFSCGKVLYGCDGSEEENRLPTDDELYRWFVPLGKLDPWLHSAKLLTDRRQPELDIILTVPFAAPLTAFLGNFYGGILSIWGDPGTAKSTAQQVAAAVWGHPKQTRESLDSTRKSVTHRLGMTKNLPAYWDDVQSDDKLEQIFNTMFLGSQGIEGSRLTAEVKQRERLDWQTLLVLCGNASFVEYVIKKQPSTTAGLRRVLEIEFKKPETEVGMIDELDATQAFGELQYNYGHMGLRYAKLLATEHDDIKAMVEIATKNFKSRVKGKADELYWWGIAGTLLTGAALARRLGVDINTIEMENFLVKAFELNRTIRASEGTEGGSQDNTDIAIAQFLNFYLGSGNCVYTDIFSAPGIPVVTLSGPGMNRPVYIQVAREKSIVRVSRKALREFLEMKNVKTRQVFDGLGKYYKAKPVRVVLAGGTDFAGVQEHCIEIPIEDPGPLAAIVRAHSVKKSEVNTYQEGLD